MTLSRETDSSGPGTIGAPPGGEVRRKVRYSRLLLCPLLLFAAVASAESLPKEALATVKQVHDASARKDLGALSALMAHEFTWSFGGDASAEQALQDWKSHPARLATLARLTAGPCAVVQRGLIQCPPADTMNYRAGFRQFPQGWRMVYFVAGD